MADGPSANWIDERREMVAAYIAGTIMPLLRYFTFVGSGLLALLFLVSIYFPETETINHKDVARPVIRILSNKVGPPRVDIDTRMQAMVAVTSVSDILQQAPAREAEARLNTPLPTPAVPIKIEVKKARVAKRSDRRRLAANPQGFQPFRLTW